jgi:hypothetical protein
MNQKIIIGAPCSPAVILSHEKIEVTRITIIPIDGMTCSGRKYYCLEAQAVEEGDEAIKCVLITGQKIGLGARYIVEMVCVNLIKMVSDTTMHSNYGGKDTCKKSVVTEYIELEFGDDYVIEKGYISRTNLPIKEVFSYKEITL